MRILFNILFAVSSAACLSGCASLMTGSVLSIQSQPSEAVVYARVEGQKEKVKLGVTPLELPETKLSELLHLSANSSQWIEITFEKAQFTVRSILIPSNRWGESLKILKLNLVPVEEDTHVVRDMIAHFFNAKKFAESSQFELAHTEIDKVLEMDPKSVPAMNIKAGIYYLQNRMDEAKKWYKQALSLDPTSSDSIKMLEKIQNQGGSN